MQSQLNQTQLQPPNAEKLKQFIRDCKEKHLHESAIFFADKFVSLSGSSLESIYVLAECYYDVEQYTRAYSILANTLTALKNNSTNSIHININRNLSAPHQGSTPHNGQHSQQTNTSHITTPQHHSTHTHPVGNRTINFNEFTEGSVEIKILYLAACCAAATRNYEDCIDILGGEDNLVISLRNSNKASTRSNKPEVSIVSSIYFLRGKAFSAIDNRSKAKWNFVMAVKTDPYCYEAFHFLHDHNMLTANEATEIVSSINFTPESAWLQEFYLCKLKKYDNFPEQHAKISDRLDNLDRLLNGNNLSVLIAKAEHYYYANMFKQAYEITSRLISVENCNDVNLIKVHICCLYELKMNNELFYYAHKLVDELPKSSVSWYAVATYYYLIQNFDMARRHYSKCTVLDTEFGGAWLGFGHAFAAQGEHDQAMAAYRSANRVLQGSHVGLLCVGIELIRVSNFNLALQYIHQAQSICSNDPLIYNELGVISFRSKRYQEAIDYFLKVLHLCGIQLPQKTDNQNESMILSAVASHLNSSWEPTLFNLAHSYRKLRDYNRAAMYYQISLSLNLNTSNTALCCSNYTCLAFTHQLMGGENIHTAIDYYHRALALKPEDSFAIEMLNTCLQNIVYSK